jgi:outer membrane protein, multidrug efflux system
MSTTTFFRRYAAAALSALALLGGCAVGVGYQAPRRELPAAWAGAASAPVTQAAAIDPAWWRGFDDPLLSRLVQQALAANTDVRIAQARLRAARAASAVAGAALAPTIGAYGSASRSNTSGQPATTEYGLGFDASWEIDVFGGLRRGAAAAQADEQQASATLASTQVSLAAEVARNYVELRSYQVRLVITRANLASQSETVQLTEWRAQAGLVSAIDVEQARTNREQTQAQVPVLETALAQSRHALALLLDQPPSALDRELAASDAPAVPQASDDVALGIPAELLRRRPDIVAAERALAAATERVGQAEAARYPSFTLSGTLGLQGLALNALTGTGALGSLLLGSMSAPIFDAGKLRQQVEIQSAAQEVALASYEATLLGALRDVENALAALANSRVREVALGRAVTAARNAAQLARHRYSSGLADFQTVLDTERSVRTIEDSVASAEADSVIALIQLYKALGGGWSADAATASADAPTGTQ